MEALCQNPKNQEITFSNSCKNLDHIWSRSGDLFWQCRDRKVPNMDFIIHGSSFGVFCAVKGAWGHFENSMYVSSQLMCCKMQLNEARFRIQLIVESQSHPILEWCMDMRLRLRIEIKIAKGIIITVEIKHHQLSGFSIFACSPSPPLIPFPFQFSARHADGWKLWERPTFFWEQEKH